MHKVVWFVRFRQDRDREEMDRRWAGEHAALCVAVPGVVRYVQNPVVTTATLEGAVDGPPPFDGFAAFWWKDRDAYLAALDTPEWQAVMDDGREIFDTEWTLDGRGAEIEERVVREGLGARGDGVGTRPTARSSSSASCATARTWSVTTATRTGPGRTASSR